MIAAPANSRAARIAADMPETGEYVIFRVADMPKIGEPLDMDKVVVGPGDMQTIHSQCLYFNECVEEWGTRDFYQVVCLSR